VMEAHGGRIWAENRSGGGAVLRFAIPLPAQQPAVETGQMEGKLL
jgi:two-component system, OmpR family, sensor histidine kinase KdpD